MARRKPKGDDVRVGSHSRELSQNRIARILKKVAGRSANRRESGHRLRRVRRRLGTLCSDRERRAHTTGAARGEEDVQEGWCSSLERPFYLVAAPGCGSAQVVVKRVDRYSDRVSSPEVFVFVTTRYICFVRTGILAVSTLGTATAEGGCATMDFNRRSRLTISPAPTECTVIDPCIPWTVYSFYGMGGGIH